MSSAIVFHSLAAFAYATLALVLWRSLASGKPVVQVGRSARFGLLSAIVLHGVALYFAVLEDNHLKLSWSLALSASVWIGMIIFWLKV